MVSLFLSLILGVVVILCLGLKMTGRRFSKSWDIAICIVVPIICLLTFLSAILETSIRRNANAKELDRLLVVVETSLSSDRVFVSNEEKIHCLDSLKLCSASIETIAYDDSLISIIAGRDTCMQRRIAQANNAVLQSVKWISRLNDIYNNDVLFIHKDADGSGIKLIGPGSEETSVLNIAFKVNELQAQPICSYVQVLNSEKTLYSKAFVYKPGINCFNIPIFDKEEAIVELGYIYQNNDELFFKYITYAK